MEVIFRFLEVIFRFMKVIFGGSKNTEGVFHKYRFFLNRKYLLKRFTNSVRQAASWRKDMMASTFAKRKKTSEKKELTSSSTSRMKLR